MKRGFRWLVPLAHLRSLDDYVHQLDVARPKVIEHQRELIWSDVDTDDECEVQWANEAEEVLEQGLLTNKISTSAVLILWSTYEICVRSIARSAAAALKGQRPTRIGGVESDLERGRGSFLKRAEIYFGSEFKVSLHPNNVRPPQLEALGNLRNAIVHAGGDLVLTHESKRQALRELVEEQAALRIVYGEIVVDWEYVQGERHRIRDLIEGLVDRTHAAIMERQSNTGGV